jgi:uncharacterized oligopeptide transporter (OPT) family protein
MARHQRTFAPTLLLPLVLIGIAGAAIGVQLLTTLGVTPNTSLVGALAAMVIGRVPFLGLGAFRSVHAQNLAQSAISAATFGAANSLLMPIGVPFVLGRSDLVVPILAGAALAMFLDAYLLYRLFGSRVFPASGAWPPGVAAAEAITAGDRGGRQARRLGAAIGAGAVGSWIGVPMAAFGTGIIGNPWALSAFGVGLLASGYDLAPGDASVHERFVPHGMMIGAGLVALAQVAAQMTRGRGTHGVSEGEEADRRLAPTLGLGAGLFVGIGALVALTGGLAASLSPVMLLAFVLYASAAAFLHELIVGLAAMHSGWFPAFAVALVTLMIGILAGFPADALALLTGFTVATGPAFADMGYDLKAGFLLRGRGADAAFEIDGRRQQFLAATVAFATALVVVALVWRGYFARDLIPPVARVFAATINAGVAPGVAQALGFWAIPGAVLQFVGGPRRQIGVLLATGLLVSNVAAGWAVVAGILCRVIWTRGLLSLKGDLDGVAAGFIAGDALFSFGDSMMRQREGA